MEIKTLQNLDEIDEIKTILGLTEDICKTINFTDNQSFIQTIFSLVHNNTPSTHVNTVAQVKRDNLYDNFSDFTNVVDNIQIDLKNKNPSVFLNIIAYKDVKIEEKNVSITFSNDYCKLIHEHYIPNSIKSIKKKERDYSYNILTENKRHLNTYAPDKTNLSKIDVDIVNDINSDTISNNNMINNENKTFVNNKKTNIKKKSNGENYYDNYENDNKSYINNKKSSMKNTYKQENYNENYKRYGNNFNYKNGYGAYGNNIYEENTYGTYGNNTYNRSATGNAKKNKH